MQSKEALPQEGGESCAAARIHLITHRINPSGSLWRPRLGAYRQLYPPLQPLGPRGRKMYIRPFARYREHKGPRGGRQSRQRRKRITSAGEGEREFVPGVMELSRARQMPSPNRTAANYCGSHDGWTSGQVSLRGFNSPGIIILGREFGRVCMRVELCAALLWKCARAQEARAAELLLQSRSLRCWFTVAPRRRVYS